MHAFFGNLKNNLQHFDVRPLTECISVYFPFLYTFPVNGGVWCCSINKMPPWGNNLAKTGTQPQTFAHAVRSSSLVNGHTSQSR